MTVALNCGWSPSIFSWFGTIRLFPVPQHEKTLGWEAFIGPMTRSYLQVRTFSRIKWESFSITGIQVLQHRWEEVCGRQGIVAWVQKGPLGPNLCRLVKKKKKCDSRSPKVDMIRCPSEFSAWKCAHRQFSTNDICSLCEVVRAFLHSREWNKPHLVKSDHCIIVSLWTFQPTLAF